MLRQIFSWQRPAKNSQTKRDGKREKKNTTNCDHAKSSRTFEHLIRLFCLFSIVEIRLGFGQLEFCRSLIQFFSPHINFDKWFTKILTYSIIGWRAIIYMKLICVCHHCLFSHIAEFVFGKISETIDSSFCPIVDFELAVKMRNKREVFWLVIFDQNVIHRCVVQLQWSTEQHKE